MKTYYNNRQVEKDVVNGVLAIDGDIEIAYDGFNINADIKCNNIYSKGYERNLHAGNIITRDIYAADIWARHIIAENVHARDIHAKDINTWNIFARDISYYGGVCFAYYNIECEHIKGYRENSKHFCLTGGKIIFKKKQKESVTLDLTAEQLEQIKNILKIKEIINE